MKRNPASFNSILLQFRVPMPQPTGCQHARDLLSAVRIGIIGVKLNDYPGQLRIESDMVPNDGAAYA